MPITEIDPLGLFERPTGSFWNLLRLLYRGYHYNVPKVPEASTIWMLNLPGGRYTHNLSARRTRCDGLRRIGIVCNCPAETLRMPLLCTGGIITVYQRYPKRPQSGCSIYHEGVILTTGRPDGRSVTDSVELEVCATAVQKLYRCPYYLSPYQNYSLVASSDLTEM